MRRICAKSKDTLFRLFIRYDFLLHVAHYSQELLNKRNNHVTPVKGGNVVKAVHRYKNCPRHVLNTFLSAIMKKVKVPAIQETGYGYARQDLVGQRRFIYVR